MKILVSKPDALGDQVLATAFVQGLRRAWPEARIVWHVRSGMEVIATLVEGASVFAPRLDDDPVAEAGRLWRETTSPIVVIPFPIHPFADWEPDLDKRYAWWQAFLAGSPWDLAVAPVVNRTGLTDFTVTASGASRRLGFAANGACQPMLEAAFRLLPHGTADFTQLVPSTLSDSEWEQQARLLDALAPGTSLSTPDLQISAEAIAAATRLAGPIENFVLLAPGVGQDDQRAWPLTHFIQIADDLAARNHPVAWIEGPHDARFFASLPERWQERRIRLEAGRPDTLAALLRAAKLVVCNDTAYVHVAAAVEVPTVAIFGAGQKSRFVPRFGRVHVVQGDPNCRGCQWQCAFSRHLCVQDVPYERVWAAIAAQLANPSLAHEQIAIDLPYPEAGDKTRELERIRDWYQEELYRIRWDGWARLQVIKTANQGILARDRQIQESAAKAAAPAPLLPRLSVIIPMGRPERADGTLLSLVGQTLQPAGWEVVVVGVGASRLLSKYPQLPLVPVDLERNLLPPRTRVEGVKRATGEWFLFLDDDVQLAPDFFEMLARVLALPHLSATPAAPVGAIGVRLPGGRGTFFEHLTDISNFWSQQSSVRAVPHSVWFLYSAAIVVRAEAYYKSGGFNPDLPNAEDVDLTQRIAASGCLLAYEPALVAYHHHGRDSLWRMWRYFWRNGNVAQYFFGQFGGVCCYSIRTAMVRGWGNLRMNRNFQKTQGVRLGLRSPWILLNYLIFESSIEWHYQKYLWNSKRYRELPARTASDRRAVAAFQAWSKGRRLVGAAHYLVALISNFTDPVRR